MGWNLLPTCVVDHSSDSIFGLVALGGPFPASGQHVETLQATLQAADQAWTEQGPAGRGEHTQQSTDRSLFEFGEAKI